MEISTPFDMFVDLDKKFYKLSARQWPAIPSVGAGALLAAGTYGLKVHLAILIIWFGQVGGLMMILAAGLGGVGRDLWVSGALARLSGQMRPWVLATSRAAALMVMVATVTLGATYWAFGASLHAFNGALLALLGLIWLSGKLVLTWQSFVSAKSTQS